MNKSQSGLSWPCAVTKGSTPCSENNASTRSATWWNNFISLAMPKIASWSLHLLWSGSRSLENREARGEKIVVNKCCCAPYIGSSPDQMPRFEASVCVCVCTDDVATDPVKQWPTEREGSLMVHRAGLLFSLALYWAMIGPNLGWSFAATNICLW